MYFPQCLFVDINCPDCSEFVSCTYASCYIDALRSRKDKKLSFQGNTTHKYPKPSLLEQRSEGAMTFPDCVGVDVSCANCMNAECEYRNEFMGVEEEEKSGE